MKISTRYLWSGALTIALGLVVLFNATFTSIAIVIVTGLVLLIGGAAQIILGFLEGHGASKWLSIVLGVFTVLLGWSFWANPFSGIFSLTTFLLILLAASGVVQMIFGYRTQGTPFFWPFIISGVISIGMAVIVISFPSATASLLGILLGIHMLASGGCLLLMGMFLKSEHTWQSTRGFIEHSQF